jgi:hypothetical protein
VIEAEFVLGGLEAFLDAPVPSTLTNVSIEVPLGHHIVK